MGVELFVGLGVEIVGANHQGDVVGDVRVQQDAAQHALFGIEVMGGRRSRISELTRAGERPASVRKTVDMG